MLCINDVALRANDVVPLGQIAVSHRRNTPTRHSLRKVLLVILSYGAVGVPRDIVKYRGVLAPKNRRLLKDNTRRFLRFGHYGFSLRGPSVRNDN